MKLPSRTPSWAAALLLVVAGFASPGAAWCAKPAACPPAPQPMSAGEMADATRRAVDRGFLWRIVKSGRASYLYGTLHVGRRPWIVPGPRVTQAFRSTDELALEIDPLDADTASRLDAAMRPGDDAPLPAALTARLDAQVRAACLPEAIDTQMSPDVLAISLAVTAGRRDGLDPAYGADLALAGLAGMAHHPVRSLETPELQMALIKGGDAAERRASIEQSLDDLESGLTRRQLLRTADIWAQGRLDELSRYADWCGCLDTEVERALMRRALDDRNPGLADGIAAIHDGGRTVFAAVGSLHMIGPQGLPELLKARGFEVERVPLGR